MEYVRHRASVRPKTTILTVIITFAVYLILPLLLAYIVYLTLQSASIWLPAVIFYILLWLFFPNYLIIKCVECYQHYASVDIRRACLCKPTCSEYAVAVLKRSFIPVAVLKIARRLLVTCSGETYKLDPP